MQKSISRMGGYDGVGPVGLSDETLLRFLLTIMNSIQLVGLIFSFVKVFPLIQRLIYLGDIRVEEVTLTVRLSLDVVGLRW